MTLCWVLPRFESVEVWPGRGYLVECHDGVQFIADGGARLPPGAARDTRFYDPPPIPRRSSARTQRSPSTPATPRTRSARRTSSTRSRRTADAASLPADRPPREPPPLLDDEHAPHDRQSPAARRRTAARAEILLCSLLDPRQLAEYRATRTFWVHGAFGSVRLGRLYRILHRSGPTHHDERWWCVVTHAHRTIPEADEWSSMLLTLAHDHERFFRVATPVASPGRRRSVAALGEDLHDAVRANDPIRAAQLAIDLGTITGGEMLEWATRWLRAHADLDPTSREAFLAHHTPLLERAAAATRHFSAASQVDELRYLSRFSMHDQVGDAVRTTEGRSRRVPAQRVPRAM